MIIHKPSFLCLFVFLPVLWCLLLFSFVNTACAHRVTVFAWVEGDTVFTESLFPDGRKIKDGSITIFDSENVLLTRGKTDENGLFSFKMPKISAINIVLDAGMGHQGRWKFSEDEIKLAIDSINPESSKAHSEKKATDSRFIEKKHHEPAEIPLNKKCPDLRQIEQIVEKIIDKKLSPVKQSLAQIQRKSPSVNDILGGIGYIIGLAGIAAYFLSKKKS